MWMKILSLGAPNTSLLPSLFIEVPVPRYKSEQSCIYVLVVSILTLSTISLLKFGTAPTAWYFLFVHFISIICNLRS